MKVDVLLGLQWGDEGKGKIVDVLTSKYDIIARFQGGPNAGHTLEFDGIKHVLHTIPSGIFHKGVTNLIGNGVVIDPIIFKEEIESINFKKETSHECLSISSFTNQGVVAIVTFLLFNDSQVGNFFKFFFRTNGTVPYL